MSTTHIVLAFLNINIVRDFVKTYVKEFLRNKGAPYNIFYDHCEQMKIQFLQNLLFRPSNSDYIITSNDSCHKSIQLIFLNLFVALDIRFQIRSFIYIVYMF